MQLHILNPPKCARFTTPNERHGVILLRGLRYKTLYGVAITPIKLPITPRKLPRSSNEQYSNGPCAEGEQCDWMLHFAIT